MKFKKPIEITKNVFQMPGRKPSCHIYLIKDSSKIVLIDTGINAFFENIERSLKFLGIPKTEIKFVINTHEHFDHIGANRYFSQTAIITAHRYAATKIDKQDDYVTMYNKCHKCDLIDQCDLHNHQVDHSLTKPHLWLEDKTFFDLGDFHLKIIHTPGHTSGCICIYEPERRILFSGDTVFASGILSGITASGSAGDYINSLYRLNSLKIDLILPGHGKTSNCPEEDLSNAIKQAKAKLFLARVKGGKDIWSETTPLKLLL